MNNKTKFDPQIHHRKSIRLKGYDYSQAGAYYVTICVKDRLCLFGNILNDEMILDEAGIMVNKWWQKIPEKFPDIELDEYQIMPNHFHAIVIITGRGRPMCLPDSRESDNIIDPAHEDQIIDTISISENDKVNTLGEHKNSQLHDVIRWFKTMTTNEYIRNVKTNKWVPFNGKLFQRNYWEHIIRNERSYNMIANYIINNPTNWHQDILYLKNNNTNKTL